MYMYFARKGEGGGKEFFPWNIQHCGTATDRGKKGSLFPSPYLVVYAAQGKGSAVGGRGGRGAYFFWRRRNLCGRMWGKRKVSRRVRACTTGVLCIEWNTISDTVFLPFFSSQNPLKTFEWLLFFPMGEIKLAAIPLLLLAVFGKCPLFDVGGSFAALFASIPYSEHESPWQPVYRMGAHKRRKTGEGNTLIQNHTHARASHTKVRQT